MGYSIERTKHGVFLHTQFFKKQQLARLGILMHQTSLSEIKFLKSTVKFRNENNDSRYFNFGFSNLLLSLLLERLATFRRQLFLGR